MIAEDAINTLLGVLRSAHLLIERTSEKLLEAWTLRREDPKLLIQPTKQWPKGLSSESTGFAGYRPNPNPLRIDQMSAEPTFIRRMRAAAMLSDTADKWKSFD